VVWETRGKFIFFILMGVVFTHHALTCPIQNGNSKAQPKRRPAVKFRNIEESVFQAIQRGGDNSNVDLSDDSEEDGSGSDSDSEGEAGPNVLGVPPPENVTFEIDVDIDIEAKALRDMVAPEPVIREEVRPRQEPPKEAQQEAVAPNWNW